MMQSKQLGDRAAIVGVTVFLGTIAVASMALFYQGIYVVTDYFQPSPSNVALICQNLPEQQLANHQPCKAVLSLANSDQELKDFN